MECACIDIDVDEYLEVLFDVNQIALDPIKCCECNKTVETGNEFTLEKTVFRNEMKFYRTCLDCRSIRKHLFCSFHYEMILEDLHSEWSEYLDIPYAKISELTKGAQETVCALIELIWENDWENEEDDE